MPGKSKRAKPKQLEFIVMLDTNALFTGSASDLFRREVATLIEENRGLPDLKIRWIIPEVVRQERQFQMLQAALQYLPTLEKIERLIGHNLNITQEILETRVIEAITRQIEQYGIVIQSLDVSNVDWNRLIKDATNRRPPFELGEKEKGFKDAIIIETFVQIVAGAPVSPAAARIILVSNDQSVRNAANARFGSSKNVYILESVDALKGLINTLGSTVDEKYIEDIKDEAAKIFFEKDDRDSLYYKSDIRSSIYQELERAKFPLPARATKYSIQTLNFSDPRFIKKQRQRIYWSTRFEARLKASKSAPPTSLISETWPIIKSAKEEIPLVAPDIEKEIWLSNKVEPSPWMRFALERPFLQMEEILVAYGTAQIDVEWSISIATSGRLTRPKLENVRFVEVVWD
jgi:hypothetical protein